METRRFVLFAVTALAVAYTRNEIQYGRRGWTTVGSFFVDWVVHVFLIAIAFGIVCVVVEKLERYFFPQQPQLPLLERDRLHVTLSLATLTLIVLGYAAVAWMANIGSG